MTPELTTQIKDLVYNLERYLYWSDEYESEHEWTALDYEHKHLQRIRQLLPPILQAIRGTDFDNQCG